MNLFQEYEKQQKWRGWEHYLEFIPYSQDDSVVDLGCSVGDVSRLFSLRVKHVTGIDINQEFIDFCELNKRSNERFICTDFLDFSNQPIAPINGIWSSFSLSYLPNPLDFLIGLNSAMKPGAWIALLDISCFISGNLPKDSRYHERVKTFELGSHQAGVYDFDFGSKIEGLLQGSGFEIVYVDNDVTDAELNFSGAAPQDIVDGWAARLNRMKRLKGELGPDYSDFCNELLANLRSDNHEKRGNVKFVVAKKI